MRLLVRVLVVVVVVFVGLDRALGPIGFARSSSLYSRPYSLHRLCIVPSDSNVAHGSWKLLPATLILQRCLLVMRRTATTMDELAKDELGLSVGCWIKRFGNSMPNLL